MSKQKTVLKSAVWVSVIMLLSKCLGFVRQALIANVFGADLTTDVYFMSSDFMTGISGAFTAALTTALVSVYIHRRVEEGEEAASRTASKVMTMFVGFSLLMILVLNLSAPFLSRLIAAGYEAEEYALLTRFLRLFSITFFFAAMQSIFAAVLNANDSFVPGKLYGFLYNPVVIVFMMLLSGRFGINSLFIGFLFANIIQLILLMLFCRKVFPFRFALPFGDPYVKQIILLALPLLVSNVLVQCNNIIDKAICTGLNDGIASAYSYAHTLEQFVTATLTATVSLILFSRFATFVAKGDTDNMCDTFFKSVSTLLLLLLPIAMIVVIGAGDIVNVVYLRGEFGAAAAHSTAMALIGFGAGLPIIAVREIYIKAHFSYQNTKMPMIASTVGVLVNAGFSLLLARFWGVFGVAAATSFSALFTIVILNRSIRRYLPQFRFTRYLGIPLLQMVLSAAVAAVPVLLLHFYLPLPPIFRFLSEAIVGLGVYEGVLLLMHSAANAFALQALKTTVLGRHS